MQVTITGLPSHEILRSREYPSDFVSENGMEEASGSLDWGSGRLWFQECWFEGMYLAAAEFFTETPFTMVAKLDTPLHTMVFCLDGQIRLGAGCDQKTNIVLNENQGAFLPAASCAFEQEVMQDAKTVFIHLTEKCLDRLNLNNRLHALTGHTAVFNIKPSMNLVLGSLSECSYPAMMKRIFLESRILELLFLKFSMQSPLRPAASDVGFRPQDIARIEHAKQLIEQNIRKPYSLLDLSRKVGLNDFKLKKGFKALLGFTVFGYLYELRMEQARQMLLEKKAVAHVAYEVGYKNPHHFSAAFKKKYGVVPSELNK